MRFQFPPDNPADAGPMLRSRLYERFVDLLPIVTYASLLWCGVVYFLLHRDTSDPGNTSELMHKLGGLTAEDLVAGRWWGLVGSAFIHYDFFHAVFNMYWLVKLGSLMERGLGSLKTAAFFIVAAFVSSSYQLVIGGAAGIGFSGVVYAMAGFMWGAWPRYTGFLKASMVACCSFSSCGKGFVLFSHGQISCPSRIPLTFPAWYLDCSQDSGRVREPSKDGTGLPLASP